MDERVSAIVKWLVIVVVVGWIGWTAADEFFDFGDIQEHTASERDQLARQMKDCRGTFKERYDCKSGLLRASGQNRFAYWAGRVAWVFGPPLALFAVFQFWRGTIARREEEELRKVRQARMEKQAEKARVRAEEETRLAAIAAKRAQLIRNAITEADRELHPLPIPTLLIDSDVTEGERIAAALRKRDFVVVIATGPDDAMIGFKDLPYRIVMTEAAFKSDGTAIDDAIPKMREHKEKAVFIVVSKKFADMAPPDIQQFAVVMGADLGFPKPLDVEKFATIVHRLIAASAAGA